MVQSDKGYHLLQESIGYASPLQHRATFETLGKVHCYSDILFLFYSVKADSTACKGFRCKSFACHLSTARVLFRSWLKLLQSKVSLVFIIQGTTSLLMQHQI
ncbi:hypothetical protein BaRGS_00027506 [Batillaria attramentaria]|uniref:Uncharacterized protein n=1 Tax=Batillaria attramentaria TaxID=370345 RepID=A0ABD0K2Y7_9CAEN